MLRKERYCPNCHFETNFVYGECVECGYKYERIKNYQYEKFDKEDEWSESDWGEDIKDERRYIR